tara:strand:+ start:276 stop:440 length:165 start_codon:yes stop_codon:yes gene_type:complete
MDEQPALNATLSAVLPQMGFEVLCIGITGLGECAQVSERVPAKKTVWSGKSMAG